MYQITNEQNVIECDLLLTDPPYGILNEDWDQIDDLKEFTIGWCKRWNDCTADYIAIFWSSQKMFDVKEWFDSSLTDYTFQQVLIWNYRNNVKCSSQMKFKFTYEPIFLYRRNGSTKKIINSAKVWGDELISLDCLTSATPQSNYTNDKKKKHPAQKPLEVMRWLVNALSEEGELVVDPFAGSGTTGIASVQLQRKFIGIEINPDYIQLAIDRIEAYGSPADATD